MNANQTLMWFAGHEMRLAWRDWAALMAGGRTAREKAVTLIVLMFTLGLLIKLKALSSTSMSATDA